MAESRSIATLRDGSPVGAWMFKARPDVWDVHAALRFGTRLDSWRMAPSYRVELVGPGHPCVLWITGPSGSTPPPGVWAVGEVTGEPYEDTGDPDDDLWRDRDAQAQVRPYVEVCLTVLDQPVERRELAGDPRFAGAEILRRPRMGSPLALRPPEVAAVADRLGFRGWPAGR